MIPCERCGAGDSSSFESDYNAAPPHLNVSLCAETQLTRRLLSMLCFACRKEWLELIETSAEAMPYQETSFRLEHWKAVLTSTGKGDIEQGLQLLEAVKEADDRIHTLAQRWLAGVDVKDLIEKPDWGGGTHE